MFLEQFYPDRLEESSYKIPYEEYYKKGYRRTKKPLPFLKDCGRSAFPAASFPIIMSQESSPLLTR